MVQNGNSNADGNAIIALPFEHGKRSLLFSRKSILGIITDPPVNVKVQVQPKTEERVPAIPGKEILVLKNFLPADLNRRLMEYAAAQEKNFVPSTVTTNEADYRNSRVLYKPSEFSRLFRDILTSNFSKVISSLDIEQLSLGEIEVQITSHGMGAITRSTGTAAHLRSPRGLLALYITFIESPGNLRAANFEYTMGLFQTEPIVDRNDLPI